MLGSVLRSMAYSTYFTVALVAFLYLSIPTGQVKRYVAHQATKNLKKKVTIGGLDIRGVSGVTLTDVRVELPLPKNETAGDMAGAPSAAKTPGSEADAEENDEPPPLFNPPGLIMADKIDLDVNTWGLVNGKKLKAVLNAELSGGTLSDVKFEAHKSGWTLEVGEMAGVDLTPMRVLRTLAKIEMDLHGRLSGRALIEWAGELQNSKADLELQLTDALIPYLPIKHPTEPYPIGEAFQVAIGDVELRMKLDKAENLPGLTTRGRQAKSGQVLLIEELKARGEHVEIQLDSGQRHTISFRSPKTSEGIIDVRLVVHFTDEFFAWKGDGVRSDGHEAKDVGHSALKSAMDSFLKHARKKIGKKYYYGFHCQGTVKNYKCPPKMPTQRVIPTIPAIPAIPATPTARSGVSTPIKRPAAPTASKFKRPEPATAKASRASRAQPGPTASRNKRKSPSPASRLVEPARDRQRARDEARRGLRPDRADEEEPEEELEEEQPTGEEREEREEEGEVDDPEAAEDDPRDADEREEEFDEDGEPIDELDEPGVGEDDALDEDLDFED